MYPKTRFEVQEHTVVDGWVNNWTIEYPVALDDYVTLPQTFETYDEAQAAIYEFFADIQRAGMAHSYSLEDYRVVPISHADAMSYN